MGDLAIRGLAKRFGEVAAVSDLSLEVPSGSFCVLLGPSGCGKSTVLRCVAGLEAVDAGEILLSGENVAWRAPRDRDLAMVFQEYALYPHMSVRANIEFPLRMRGVPSDQRSSRVEETARLLRIESLLDRRPRELSGGQRQRVAIGRAVVRRPGLFLFDEPLSNLDAKLRTELRLEIARLHQRLGATIVYVTHDQVEAMTLGEQLVVMNEGRIEQRGTPEAIYARPENLFVAGFLGTPAMNLHDGRIEAGRFHGPGYQVAVSLPDAPAVTLGVRPEDVRAEEGSGRGRVELVDRLGARTYAHVRIGEGGAAGLLTLECASDRAPRQGEELPYRILEDRVHLFMDGERIGS